ncbi:MAG: hypothetical protein H7145_23520 [Akkermansiaceae bacterium]|nr:hypothetical protein [Armatimonadota bacterium]
MIRFSASEPEITGLLRFLERRARRLIPMDKTGRAASLLWLPLATDNRDDLRPRRTSRSLLRLLRDADDSLPWGVRLATDASHAYSTNRDTETGRYHVEPETSRLILFAFGPVMPEERKEGLAPERRREGIIELRDWVEEEIPIAEAPSPKGVVFLPQTLVARDLVERCARRLRRRGNLVDNRWHVPPHLPEDDE